MGLKFVLTVIIMVIVTVSFLVEIKSTFNKNQASSIDIEFNNTTFIEVDTQKIQGWIYSTHGVHDQAVLTLDNIVFHTENIDSLRAKKGKYENDILYLDGDVEMKEKEGHTYKTQHANYNQNTEILNITAPFTSRRDQSIIKGQSLHYNAAKKEVFATKIDAILYTTEK